MDTGQGKSIVCESCTHKSVCSKRKDLERVEEEVNRVEKAEGISVKVECRYYVEEERVRSNCYTRRGLGGRHG